MEYIDDTHWYLLAYLSSYISLMAGVLLIKFSGGIRNNIPWKYDGLMSILNDVVRLQTSLPNIIFYLADRKWWNKKWHFYIVCCEVISRGSTVLYFIRHWFRLLIINMFPLYNAVGISSTPQAYYSSSYCIYIISSSKSNSYWCTGINYWYN